MKRGIVFTIHSVAGLVFGLFILMMSLSGAVLVFHEELDRLQYPADVARANGGIVPVDSCYNNLKKNFPGAQISSCLITKSNQRSFVFTIYDSSYKSGREALKVFMHPQNGTIQETKGANSFYRQLVWQIALFIFPGQNRGMAAWFFCVGLFIKHCYRDHSISGKMYGQYYLSEKGFSRKNLHQLVGVYALLFNLMIGITGFWMQRYVFKKDFYTG